MTLSRLDYKAIPLRVASSSSSAVAWEIDGKTAGTSRKDARSSWVLASGRHIFTARNAAGETAAASITVR